MTNSIAIHGNRIDIKVGVFVFKEGDFYIAYCPSLDLAGYSDTKDEAKKDFEFILNDWLETQVANNTLSHDLASHGWSVGKDGGREPSIDDIPNKEEINRIVNLPEYIKTSMSAQMQYC